MRTAWLDFSHGHSHEHLDDDTGSPCAAIRTPRSGRRQPQRRGWQDLGVLYLAYALSLMGYRVLAIDLDFQSSLSAAFHEALPSVEVDGAMNVLLSSSEEVFFDRRVVSDGYPPRQNLTVVRTTFELADVEDRLFADFILGRSGLDARFALARKLAEPRLRKNFDIVLIDTPPRLTIGSLNALCAGTHVLIPTAPTVMSISGAVTFVDILKRFKQSLALRLIVLAVLPTLTFQQGLNPREKKLLDDLGADLRDIEIWKDLNIPRKQAIAENRKLNDLNIEPLFKPLALKIESTLGLTRHGSDSPLGAHRDSRLGRFGLS
jgi:cellulose biosynthesis protein BcsQ